MLTCYSAKLLFTSHGGFFFPFWENDDPMLDRLLYKQLEGSIISYPLCDLFHWSKAATLSIALCVTA